MENNPTYKIHGEERRKLKKELNELKRYVKDFLHNHQLDKDMYSFFGSDLSSLLTDEQANTKINETRAKIKGIERRLALPYFE